MGCITSTNALPERSRGFAAAQHGRAPGLAVTPSRRSGARTAGRRLVAGVLGLLHAVVVGPVRRGQQPAQCVRALTANATYLTRRTGIGPGERRQRPRALQQAPRQNTSYSGQ